MSNSAFDAQFIQGPHGPYIHACMQNTKRAWGFARERNYPYELVFVEDGTVELTPPHGKPSSLATPCGLLLGPESEFLQIQLNPGAHWYLVRFDLMYRPRRFRPSIKRTAQVVAMSRDQRVVQPTTLEVYGRTLPLELPEHLFEQCQQTVRFCCANWYRDLVQYGRSNYRLGQFLLDWVDSTLQGPRAPARSWVEAVIAAAKDQLHFGIDVEDLARISGYSRTHFCLRFKEQTAQTPKEFLDMLRGEEACRLLRSSNESVTSIAARCGYNSPMAFSRFFRNRYGTSPSSWRRSERFTG
jgi:AraC-like DNA-binding protein